MRPPLHLLLLVLGALLASAGQAPAQAGSDAAAASLHLDDASLPDPTKSPGDFSRDLDAIDLCDTPVEEFAKTPPKALCEDVFEEARVPADYRFQYACVFLVPPAIGGTQSRANIWLQPAAEASLKASADAAARKHICKSPADLAEAQHLLAVNWVGAYRRYLLPGDKLAPIAKLERGPDNFGLLPPAPAEEGGAPFEPSYGGAGGAYGYDPAYGEGTGYGYGDGGGGAGSDDRRGQRRGLLQDDRRRQSGPRERTDGAGRSRDGRGPALRERDGRRQDDTGRGPDGRDGTWGRPERPHDGAPPGGRPPDNGRRHDGAGHDPDGHGGVGRHPVLPYDGRRPDDGRPDDGRRHDEAGGDPGGRDGVGRHPDMPHDGSRPGDGRSDDGRRGKHSHDWPGDRHDGHDFGPRGGDRDGYYHPEGSRPDDPRRSFGDRDGGWPHRRTSRGPTDRGFGLNHPFEHGNGRFPLSRYARAQDVRLNDVRPNNVRPNDVRPTRPGLGRPFYPGGMRHTGGRGGGRRR